MPEPDQDDDISMTGDDPEDDFSIEECDEFECDDSETEENAVPLFVRRAYVMDDAMRNHLWAFLDMLRLGIVASGTMDRFTYERYLFELIWSVPECYRKYYWELSANAWYSDD